MLSTGDAHPVGLFTYIAMLDAGLIAVLIARRTWKVLAPLSLAATFLIYYLWYGSSAGDGDGGVSLVFLGIFWLLFHGYDIATELLSGEVPGIFGRLTAVANTVLVYPGFYLVLDRYFEPWLAPGTLLLCLLYAGSGVATRRVVAGPLAPQARFAATAIVLLVIATEIHFGDFVVVPVYVAEAVILFWIGMRNSVKQMWGMGIGILIWACLATLGTDHLFFKTDMTGFVLLWNLRSLALLSLAGGAGAMLFMTKTASDGPVGALRILLHLIWVFFVFFLITVETGDYFHHLAVRGDDAGNALLLFQRLMTTGLFWLVFGAMLFCAGHRGKIVILAVLGIILIVLGTGLVTIRGIAFTPIEAFVSLFNIRMLVLLLATALLGWSVYEISRARVLADWDEEIRLLLRILLVVATLVLISGEIRDYYERAIALRFGESESATLDLENLKQMFLSAAWLVYSIGLMGVGILRRARTLRTIAMVLFGIAILKIFFYDLSFLETLYRIVSFLGLGVILLTVSYLYQRYKSVFLEDSPGS